MSFADKLRELRRYTPQAKFAERMPEGFSFRTLQEWEQGKRTPPAWLQSLVLAHLENSKPEYIERVHPDPIIRQIEAREAEDRETMEWIRMALAAGKSDREIINSYPGQHGLRPGEHGISLPRLHAFKRRLKEAAA